MKCDIEFSKDLKIFRDWLLSQKYLSVRDIEKEIIIRGFSSCPNLACCYAFFLSEFQLHRDNENLERVLNIFVSMIVHEFLDMYDFYPYIDSHGLFGYSSRRA